MFNENIVFSRFILVSIGSIIGTWIRFNVVSYFQRIHGRGSFGTFAVNISASFFLGLCITMDPLSFEKEHLAPFYLFFCVGLFGSMSTFSSFVLDVMKSFIEKRFKDSLIILFHSLTFGLLAIRLGYFLSNGY